MTGLPDHCRCRVRRPQAATEGPVLALRARARLGYHRWRGSRQHDQCDLAPTWRPEALHLWPLSQSLSAPNPSRRGSVNAVISVRIPPPMR